MTMDGIFDARRLTAFASSILLACSLAVPCAYGAEEGSSSMEVTIVGGEDWENETVEVPVVGEDGRPAEAAQGVAAGMPKTGDALAVSANIAISCAVASGSLLLACFSRTRRGWQ